MRSHNAFTAGGWVDLTTSALAACLVVLASAAATRAAEPVSAGLVVPFD